MKPARLAIILAVGSGLAGTCYVAAMHYVNCAVERSCFFDLPNPCRPKGLAAAMTNALPSDGAMQQKIAGTWWHFPYAFYFDDRLDWTLSRVEVASNGDYVCHVTYLDGVTHSNLIQGRWRVKDGLLFDTITNYCFNLTNDRVLKVFSNRVVGITDRELVYRMCPDGQAVLFRRVRHVNR